MTEIRKDLKSFDDLFKKDTQIAKEEVNKKNNSNFNQAKVALLGFYAFYVESSSHCTKVMSKYNYILHIDDVHDKLETWQKNCNAYRSHISLINMTSVEFIIIIV